MIPPALRALRVHSIALGRIARELRFAAALVLAWHDDPNLGADIVLVADCRTRAMDAVRMAIVVGEITRSEVDIEVASETWLEEVALDPTAPAGVVRLRLVVTPPAADIAYRPNSTPRSA